MAITDSGPDTAKVFTFTFGIPAGEIGPAGTTGPQGETGATGEAAGFGVPTATATALPAGSQPTVTVTATGPDTAKVFNFTFGIPSAEA